MFDIELERPAREQVDEYVSRARDRFRKWRSNFRKKFRRLSVLEQQNVFKYFLRTQFKVSTCRLFSTALKVYELAVSC